MLIKLKSFNRLNKQKEIDRALCLCCRALQFIYLSVKNRFGEILMNHPKISIKVTFTEFGVF